MARTAKQKLATEKAPAPKPLQTRTVPVSIGVTAIADAVYKRISKKMIAEAEERGQAQASARPDIPNPNPGLTAASVGQPAKSPTTAELVSILRNSSSDLSMRLSTFTNDMTSAPQPEIREVNSSCVPAHPDLNGPQREIREANSSCAPARPGLNGALQDIIEVLEYSHTMLNVLIDYTGQAA